MCAKSQIDRLAQVIEAYLGVRDQSSRWFALKADVSPSYIYKILNREPFSPTIDMLTKISSAMGIELGDLLRQSEIIETNEPQHIFSTTELFDRIPKQYQELFKGKNEQYLELAQKMLAAEVEPGKVERVIRAMLDIADT